MLGASRWFTLRHVLVPMTLPGLLAGLTLAWARAGKGPSMIEGITYRWYDHAGFAGGRVGQDGAMGLPYRTDEELKQWMSRDPIIRFKKWLLAKGLTSEAELTSIDADVAGKVTASVQFARGSSDPAPEAGVLNTYASEAVLPTQFYNRKNVVTKLT